MDEVVPASRILLETLGSASGRRCHYCKRRCNKASVKFYHGRKLICVCNKCPIKLKPTPVGEVVGSIKTGLYRILARKAL